MKKYDCSKTLDYDHEVNRMCKTIPTSPIGKCPNCLLANIGGCSPASGLTQRTIDIVQKWSDEHPEQPKLTKREYEFLTTFVPHRAVKKAIERIPNKGLYIAFYSEMNDEVDGYVEGYAEEYLIDPNLFEFIKEGERWYFKQLFDLEVEEKNEAD